MHCPQCGLEQVSGETRYCRACGFELEDVKELISEKRSERQRQERRNKAFNQGLGLMMVSLVLVIVMSLLNDLELMPEILVKTIAASFVLAGITRMFYPYVVDRTDKRYETSLDSISAETSKLSLPSPGVPANDWSGRTVETAKPLMVPSVTESTTRKLDKDGDLSGRR